MTLHHFTIADLQRALHEGELSAREIARQELEKKGWRSVGF